MGIRRLFYTATERSQTEAVVLEIDAAALRAMMASDSILGYAVQKHIIEVLIDRIAKLCLPPVFGWT